MKIEYSAYYKTDKGHYRIVNGFLDDDDIRVAIDDKEDRDEIGFEAVSLESVTIEKVEL